MNLKYCCWVLALGLFTNATLSWGISTSTNTLTISGNVLPRACEIESGGDLSFGDVEVGRAQFYTAQTSTIVKCPAGVDFTISIESVVNKFNGFNEKNNGGRTMVGIYTTAEMSAAAQKTARTFTGGGVHNVPWYGKLYNLLAPQQGPGAHGSFSRNVNVVITF